MRPRRRLPGPPTRVTEIEVSQVADGSVVYDPTRNRVHYLNQTAALVLEQCDGLTPEASIVQVLQDAYGLPEPPAAEVADCLTRLRSEGLVT